MRHSLSFAPRSGEPEIPTEPPPGIPPGQPEEVPVKAPPMEIPPEIPIEIPPESPPEVRDNRGKNIGRKCTKRSGVNLFPRIGTISCLDDLQGWINHSDPIP